LGPATGLAVAIERLIPVDPREHARTLYATLRALDAEGAETIVVALPPPRGLGLAIVAQLARASGATAELTPRPEGGIDASVRFKAP
jgi:hypothetical protein